MKVHPPWSYESSKGAAWLESARLRRCQAKVETPTSMRLTGPPTRYDIAPLARKLASSRCKSSAGPRSLALEVAWCSLRAHAARIDPLFLRPSPRHVRPWPPQAPRVLSTPLLASSHVPAQPGGPHKHPRPPRPRSCRALSLCTRQSVPCKIAPRSRFWRAIRPDPATWPRDRLRAQRSPRRLTLSQIDSWLYIYLYLFYLSR